MRNQPSKASKLLLFLPSEQLTSIKIKALTYFILTLIPEKYVSLMSMLILQEGHFHFRHCNQLKRVSEYKTL